MARTLSDVLLCEHLASTQERRTIDLEKRASLFFWLASVVQLTNSIQSVSVSEFPERPASHGIM